MNSQKSISIIIPTFNKEKRLKYLLESLKVQDGLYNTSIIIVNDGSTDGTEDLIMQYQECLDICYLYEENKGRSHARNLGLSYVRTHYVIFCDDDMILPPQFISTHLKCLLNNPQKAIHGKIYSLPYLSFLKDPSSDAADCSYNLKRYLLDKDIYKTYHVIDKQKKRTVYEMNLQDIFTLNIQEFNFLMCNGGNLSINTKALLEVGGFCESLDKHWGMEDIELGFRLNMEGIEFIYCDDAYNYHICHHRKNYKSEFQISLNDFYNTYHDKRILELEQLIFKRLSN